MFYNDGLIDRAASESSGDRWRSFHVFGRSSFQVATSIHVVTCAFIHQQRSRRFLQLFCAATDVMAIPQFWSFAPVIRRMLPQTILSEYVASSDWSEKAVEETCRYFRAFLKVILWIFQSWLLLNRDNIIWNSFHKKPSIESGKTRWRTIVIIQLFALTNYRDGVIGKTERQIMQLVRDDSLSA